MVSRQPGYSSIQMLVELPEAALRRMPSMENEELVEAVRAGDVEATRSALGAGADPNASERRWGGSVLAIAARNGRDEIVQLLLDAGASPNSVSRFDWTPLRAAAIHGHARIVSVLLDRGADPNSGDKRGSILHEVLGSTPGAASTRAAILEALLAAGATAHRHEEPLIVGAISHAAVPAVLRVLLAHGESPNERRQDGLPVLVLAAQRDDPAAVDTLLQTGADADATDATGRTALMHAVERGHERVVRILLAHGADTDLRAPDGTTALLLARALHRSRMQFPLGVRDMRREAIQATRTTMELRPEIYQLRGDLQLFDTWARIVEHTIADLGDDEFETLVSNVDDARRFADRLRRERIASSETAAWHFLNADASEVAVVRGCLLNLAYGPGMEMPEGLSRIDVADMFEDLARQADR
jgi:uncharacterized protein